jgi:hypothetical protein
VNASAFAGYDWLARRKRKEWLCTNCVAVRANCLHGFTPAPGVHLLHNPVNVVPDRILREVQLRSDLLRWFQEWLILWRRAEISAAASTFTTFTTVTTVGSARGPETLGSFLDPAVAAK